LNSPLRIHDLIAKIPFDFLCSKEEEDMKRKKKPQKHSKVISISMIHRDIQEEKRHQKARTRV